MLKKIKWIAVILAICTVAFAFSGCKSGTHQEAEEPFTVTIAQSSDPQNLDPHKVGGDISRNVTVNICEALVSFDKDWNCYGLLAQSYTQVSDTEWIFKLRDGIKFSNGEPFNAEAVIWNFKRASSNEYPRQNLAFKNYVVDYEAPDNLTVKFILSKPDIYFVEHCSEVPILAPKHSEEIGEEAISNDPVGTGPYVLVSHEADKEIVLERNVNYWGDKPEIDRVVFRTIPEASTRVAEMINGSVDIVMNVQYESTDMLKSTNTVSVFPKKLQRYEYIGFNTYDWARCPALKDKRVRQALNYAVDVDTIIENIMGGYAERMSTLWRPDYGGYDSELAKTFTYNPEKAKQLLSDAGYPNGFDLVLMTDVDNHAKAQEVTEAVGSYLQAVGINTEVKVLDDTTAYAIIVNGQEAKQCPPLFDWNWISKPGMYESLLTGVLHPSGMSSYNVIPGYESVIDSILAETNKDARLPYIEQLQQLLVDDPACLYLFTLYDIYAVNKRIDWNPMDYYAMRVSDMRIAK